MNPTKKRLSLILAFAAALALGATTKMAAAQQTTPDTAPSVDVSNVNEQCGADDGSCVYQRVRVTNIVTGNQQTPVDNDPDHDGFVGLADDCPKSPETVNGYVDTDGCPDEVSAVTHVSTANHGYELGFGGNAELLFVNQGPELGWRKLYMAGLHLDYVSGDHKLSIVGGIGGCMADNRWDDLGLSGDANYAYTVSGPVHLGARVRGTLCHNLSAPGGDMQTFHSFGGEGVVGVKWINLSIGAARFTAYKPIGPRLQNTDVVLSVRVNQAFQVWEF